MLEKIDKKGWFAIILGLIEILILIFLIHEDSKVIVYLSEVFLASIGGIATAFLVNYLADRSRIKSKRRDAYHAHRNAIVQIEHELIPSRIKLSNNLKAIEDAVENTNDSRSRLILRTHDVSISDGLNLKILNLELINLYSEVFILLEKINSDIYYLNLLVGKLQEKVDANLLFAYNQIIEHLLVQCKKADEKTLELLSKCRIALEEDGERYKESYLADGELIQYTFDSNMIDKFSRIITSQEDRPYMANEAPNQAFMLYLDLYKQ